MLVTGLGAGIAAASQGLSLEACQAAIRVLEVNVIAKLSRTVWYGAGRYSAGCSFLYTALPLSMLLASPNRCIPASMHNRRTIPAQMQALAQRSRSMAESSVTPRSWTG